MQGNFRSLALVPLLLAGWAFSLPVRGQDPPRPIAPGKKGISQPRLPAAPAAAPADKSAPQVVIILHRLNGLKLLKLLVRSDDRLRAISELDDHFKLMGDAHTNVVAGLAIEDGRTIVVRLPELEAELGSPLLPFAPKIPLPPDWPLPPPQPPEPEQTAAGAVAGFFDAPDVTVIGRGGEKLSARYIGLDGVTGLSVLRIEDDITFPTVKAQAEAIRVGQRMRLFTPEAAAAPGRARSVKVKVGELAGTVTTVTRAPGGGPFRLKINADGLSPANIGGVAISQAGETVGIIDDVEQGQAVVLSSAQIRDAARRVLKKQSSVPKPWLGVSGEPIAALAPDNLVSRGWRELEAVTLTRERMGILVNSVTPDSPASNAALRPGDVILQMNGESIHSAEHFTWFLEQAGPGASVSLTVKHPGKSIAETVNLTLSGTFSTGMFSRLWARSSSLFKQRLFHTHGIEAVGVMPAAVERMGASGGLLVFSVQPDSPAFKAGILPGDVIEAIDGQKISVETPKVSSWGKTVTFSIVRRKQRLNFVLVNE